MKKITNLELIRERIRDSEVGSVFVAADFADISDKTSVNAYLARLVEEGLIRRVLRGVYDKPEYNDFLSEFVVASPKEVANALARNFGWTIAPCGDAALNILGLSTQVPSVWSYVSDGAYKVYSYGNVVIKFKKTTNKEISRLSDKTVLTVQALRALGKESVDESVIVRLKAMLTKEEKQKMLEEAKIVTSWIYSCIKRICGEG